MPAPPSPAPPVARLDLARYAGLWHEISRADNAFQRACRPGTTTARYAPPRRRGGARREPLRHRARAARRRRAARGVAWPADPARGDGRLRVSFVPLLPVAVLRRLPAALVSAPYDVVYVSPDYREAVVRSGRLWWVLARTPALPDARRDALEARARARDALRRRPPTTRAVSRMTRSRPSAGRMRPGVSPWTRTAMSWGGGARYRAGGDIGFLGGVWYEWKGCGAAKRRSLRPSPPFPVPNTHPVPPFRMLPATTLDQARSIRAALAAARAAADDDGAAANDVVEEDAPRRWFSPPTGTGSRVRTVPAEELFDHADAEYLAWRTPAPCVGASCTTSTRASPSGSRG